LYHYETAGAVLRGLGGSVKMTDYRSAHWAAVALGAVVGIAAPGAAQAQDAAALDALVDGAETPTGAVTLARQQAESGDLTGAASTLERALLRNQNAHDLRLFYAGLLCQLDDPQGARVEVSKLDKQTISDSDWDATNAACGGSLTRPTAPKAGSGTGFVGEASLGLAFDGDALGPLIIQIDLPNAATPSKSGLSVIAGVRGAYKSPSYAQGGGLYAGGGVRLKHSVDGPDQKYLLADMRVGFGRQSDRVDYGVGAVIRHTNLFGNAYSTEYGGQAELGAAAGEGGRIGLRGEAVYQDYSSFGVGSLAKGWRFDLSASYEKQMSENSSIVVGAALELKDAKARELGYTGARVFAAYTANIGDHGHYVSLSSTARFINFKDNPPVQDRKDTRFFARGAYGLPLGNSGFKLEGAVSYTSRAITGKATISPPPLLGVKLADYDSVGAELRLVFKF
jgi:hypothetical protein